MIYNLGTSAGSAKGTSLGVSISSSGLIPSLGATDANIHLQTALAKTFAPPVKQSDGGFGCGAVLTLCVTLFLAYMLSDSTVGATPTLVIGLSIFLVFVIISVINTVQHNKDFNVPLGALECYVVLPPLRSHVSAISGPTNYKF